MRVLSFRLRAKVIIVTGRRVSRPEKSLLGIGECNDDSAEQASTKEKATKCLKQLVLED